jgi:hypothetical protein
MLMLWPLYFSLDDLDRTLCAGKASPDIAIVVVSSKKSVSSAVAFWVNIKYSGCQLSVVCR